MTNRHTLENNQTPHKTMVLLVISHIIFLGISVLLFVNSPLSFHESNNLPDEAKLLTLSNEYTSTPNDARDWFLIELKHYQSIEIRVSNYESNGGLYLYKEIISDEDEPIAITDNTNENDIREGREMIIYKDDIGCLEPGKYHILINTVSEMKPETVYTLSIEPKGC